VEVLSGVVAVTCLSQFGVNVQGLIYLVLIWALLTASVIDLEHQIIPDEISIYGRWVGLALSFFVPALHGSAFRDVAVGRSLIGAVVGGGCLYMTGLMGNVGLLSLRHLGVGLRRRPFWRKKLSRYRHMKESMGGGDVKLMAMVGSVLGWKLALLAFFLAPIFALLPGLVMLIVKRANVIPYGPFLSLGSIVALFVGNTILQRSGIEETIRLLWSYYYWPSS